MEGELARYAMKDPGLKAELIMRPFQRAEVRFSLVVVARNKRKKLRQKFNKGARVLSFEQVAGAMIWKSRRHLRIGARSSRMKLASARLRGDENLWTLD
jgi:hypothetical protein